MTNYTTPEQVKELFIDRLDGIFTTPEQATKYYVTLAERLRRFTPYQLSAGAAEIVNNRTVRAFPSIAECIKACSSYGGSRPDTAKLSGRFAPPQPGVKTDRDYERDAAALVRSSMAMAERARDERWLQTLLEFTNIKEAGRLPVNEHEIERLKQRAARADKAADDSPYPKIFWEWRRAMYARAEERVFGKAKAA